MRMPEAALPDDDTVFLKGIAASILSGWWSKPTSKMVLVCSGLEFKANVLETWRQIGWPTDKLNELLNMPEKFIENWVCLSNEYERLFVGPGLVPCPPYEAVWRADRPKHEEGCVTGVSSQEVKRLYGEMGLQIKGPELPDHIAIEWEALAYAWQNNAEGAISRQLATEHLAIWMPPFCASVAVNTTLPFYQLLAEVTAECAAGLAEFA